MNNTMSLSKDARNIIRNVYESAKEEKENGMLTPMAPLKRTLEMTGCKESTVRKVLRESQPQTQKAHLGRKKLLLDEFDKSVVRRTVHTMYNTTKMLPTLDKIQKELSQAIGYRGSKGHLRCVLKDLGFSYRRCKSSRVVMMERNDIVLQRITYLKNIKRMRDTGRTIYYCDETYVNTGHSVTKCWQSEDSSLHVPISKGERMIILHCGNEHGFLQGCQLIFKAKSKTGDYHHEMNRDNFVKWLTTQFIPNAKPHSVLVIDNAPYHNTQEDRVPTTGSKVGDIKEWLRRKGVGFDATLKKNQLLEICKRHKPASSLFTVDQIMTRHGHSVVRLPPYHPDLNPIELIWASLKGYVARGNMTFKLADVKILIQEGFQSIGTDAWARCCRHVKDIEAKFWREDIAPSQTAQAPIVIPITGSDSEETDSVDESTDTAKGTDTDTAPGTETDTDTAPGTETDTAPGSDTVTASNSDTADDC